jgi:hypothetical protein
MTAPTRALEAHTGVKGVGTFSGDYSVDGLLSLDSIIS